MKAVGFTHLAPGNWSMSLRPAANEERPETALATDHFRAGPVLESTPLQTTAKSYQHLVEPGLEALPELLEASQSEDPIERKVAHRSLDRFRFGPKSWEKLPNPVEALENRGSFGRFRPDFPSGFWKENEEILRLCEKLPTAKFFPAVDFVVRGRTAFQAKVLEGAPSYQEGVDACDGWLKKWEGEGRFQSQGRSPENSRLVVRDGVPTLIATPPTREELPDILTPDLVEHYLVNQESMATTDDLVLLLKLTKGVSEQKPLHPTFVRHIPKLLRLAESAETHNSLNDGFSNMHQMLVSDLADAFPEEMRRPEVIEALAPLFRSKEYLDPRVAELAAETWKQYPQTLNSTLEEMAKTPPSSYMDETKNKLFLRAVDEFGAEPSRQAKAWAASQLHGLPKRGVCGYQDAKRTAPILDAMALLEERDPKAFDGLNLPFEGRDLAPKDYVKALAFDTKTTITVADVDSAVQGFDYSASFLKYMGYDRDPGELWELADSKSPDDKFGRIIALSLLGNLAKSDYRLRPSVIEAMNSAPERHFKVLAKELLLLDGLQKELPEEELPQPFKLRLMEPWDLDEALKAYPGDFLSSQLIRWQHPGGDLEMKRERLEFHRELKKAYNNWERIEESFCGEMDLRMKLGDDFVDERLPKIEAFYRNNDLDGLKNYLHVEEIAHGSRATELAELEFDEDEIMIGGFSLEVN